MSDVLPHMGASLVAACIILSLARRFATSKAQLSSIFIATIVLMLIPMGEFSASHYIRVITGDLSMPSFIWLSAGAGQTLYNGKRARSRQERYTAMAVLLMGVCLYPSALGLSPLDAYSLGYAPVYLGPIIYLLFACAVWLNYWIPAISLALALAAYHFKLLESNNLWDYLIDPVILVYCLSVLVMDRRELLSSGRRKTMEE